MRNYIYFITTRIEGFVSLFKNKEFVGIIIESLNHCRKTHEFLIIAYVIMPEHIHLLILPYGNMSVPDIMRDFKKYTAKRILENLKRAKSRRLLWFFSYRKHLKGINSVWERGFVSLIVYTEKIFHIKLNYIHFNPVKKCFVKHPKDYLYSSYSEYYLGERGPLPIDNVGINFLEDGCEVVGDGLKVFAPIPSVSDYKSDTTCSDVPIPSVSDYKTDTTCSDTS